MDLEKSGLAYIPGMNDTFDEKYYYFVQEGSIYKINLATTEISCVIKDKAHIDLCVQKERLYFYNNLNRLCTVNKDGSGYKELW